MAVTRLRAAAGVPAPLVEGFAKLRQRLEVPDSFPPAALAEAERTASDHAWPERDATDIEFVTIDPEGSTDLDQAVHIDREGDGYLVRYAIADLTTFVPPDGALDAEVRRRGLTFYAPNGRTPLHPTVISEGAASLLPGQDRPAVLWELHLDAAGELTRVGVERAKVRSREQLTYVGVQAALDGGTASDVLILLREVGLRREQIEAARGGVSLQLPDQEVVAHGDTWALEFRTTLPVERWNAQISLLTGMAAARLMVEGGIGILRTLPPAEQAAIDRLRHAAKGLKLRWPGEVSYPEFVRGLDPTQPAQLAMLNACTTLFRGAGYAAFDGEPPEQPLHGAVAAPYAHCTAPLRRLVDRMVTQVCLSLSAGDDVPEWTRLALPDLPAIMAASDSREKKYERGILGLVEALVLRSRVGESFVGTVVEYDENRRRGEVQLVDPAVLAPFDGVATLGTEVTMTLAEADAATGRVLFRA